MGLRRMQVLAACLAALVLLFSSEGAANTPTFNAIFFQPATGRNPYLMLHGTETLHQFQFDAGAIFSYSYRPLQVLQGGTRVDGVIDALMVGDVVAAFGATEWLQFGFDVPYVLYNRFSDPQNIPQLPMQTFRNFGDVRIEAKGRFLDSWRKPVGIAVVPFVTIPTGNSSHYVGDSGLTGGVRIALDGRVHPSFALTFNAGYQGGRKVQIRNIEFQHLLLVGIGGNGAFRSGFGVAAEVNAQAAFNKLFRDRDLNPVEAMVSANYDIKKSGVTVYAGGGTCFVCGMKGSRVVAAVGAKYRYNPEKYQTLDVENWNACESRLGKKLSVAELKDLKMKCPPNPAEYQAGVHDPACPKYYELAELADLVLRCPSKAEDFNPRYHDAACPKVFNLADSLSSADIMNIYELSAAEMGMLCPPNPSEFNPQLHDQGCPKYYDLKEVAMLSQRCPKDAGEYVEGRDDPSCPKFYELRETYPEQAWMAIADFSEQERALYGTDGIAGGEIQQLRPIYFDFAKSAIRPDTQPTLDAVIAFINRTPWIGRIRVGGNADARGTSVGNERVAQHRAEAVIGYLQSHGLRPDVRLEPISYGANRPVAPNTTEANRALNRRVVFIVTGWYSPKASFTKGRPPVRAEAVGETPAAEPAAREGDDMSPLPPPPARWQ